MASCTDPEGWRLVSRTRDFDIALCAQEAWFFPAIQALFILFALARLAQVSRWEKQDITKHSRWRLIAKLVLLGLAFSASVANLVFIALRRVPVPFFPNYPLEAVLLLVALPLTYLNHQRTRRSSTLLLLFWPIYTLFTVVWTRSVLHAHHAGINRNGVVGLRWAAVGFGLFAFALELISPAYVDKGSTESPTLTANIFSIWSFGWMSPLLQKGVKEYITEADLPDLEPEDHATPLGEKLEKAYVKRKSLWTALFFAYGGSYMFAALLKIFQDALNFLQPQLLRWLLSYISSYQSARDRENLYFPMSRLSGGSGSPVEGYSIAAMMFIASIIQTVILHQYFQRCFTTGMRVRAGLVSLIYQKALKLSNDGRSRASGDVVNLMSVDAQRMQDLCSYGLIAISGPFQILLAFVSLYNLLGWSAFVGVAIMVFSIPLNTFIARILQRMQKQQMANRDSRTRLMSELLANIKSIKLYAWEFAFIRRVLFVRNEKELRMLRKIGVATALNSTLWGGIPLLVAFSSLATAAAVSSKPLTADIIFPSISLFMLLQFPLAMFAQVTSNIVEAIVAVRRLSEFLAADELQPDAVTRIEEHDATRQGQGLLADGEEVLSVKGGEFWWNAKDTKPTLEDINLSVRKGELIGVLGRVGAGKSSLLSAIIGDMRKTEGEVVVRGNVAYAAQNPWILSATVRDNILFSHEYDEEFYEIVIEACALKHDLALLSQGDLTEVGEKGITLSGGQRARVALARAVYARADLVLLDDVLAAVDAHVARHIFDKVIGPKGLLASKARVVVTNGIAYLRHFDQIVFVRRGIVLETGSYEALMAREDGEIRKLIANHATNANGSTSSSGYSTPFAASRSGAATPRTEGSSPTAVSEIREDDLEKIVSEKGLVPDLRREYGRARLAALPNVRELATSGPTKEHSEQGRVKKTVYKEYLKAASRWGFALFLLAQVLQQATSILSSFILRALSDANDASGGHASSGKYIAGYGIANLASVLCGAAAALLMWVYCSLRSSRRLHDSMLDAVMRAPLSFFELTPTGRILNLFSRDIYVVDSVLARVIQNLVRTTASCLSIILVIGISFPPFLIAVIPLGWVYKHATQYYLATSRELKRLDSVSRSPIYAWFSESLSGLPTIRAYAQQSVFIAQNAQRLDRNQICYLPSTNINRWLAVRLEFVGSSIIFIAAILSVTAVVTTGVDAGLVGLVLSYALNTTSSLNWLVRSAGEVEQNIVSVERILYYADELPPEAPFEIEGAETRTGEGWPAEGAVEFRDYSMRYRPELDLVLKNINLDIKPQEKIGIVGRTGAGKSSLLLALFRIIEPASGAILLDGVDIGSLGLHELRSAISIVPQNPDLFEGTLRENIDPVGEHADVDIWTALEHAHLKPYIESLPEGLDSHVAEAGSSLSAGQKQLLCFARALLRKSKVLVLDEATSAVDLDTDKAIQEIIRGPLFKNVTILTIAHRLNTIIESDRVLVLDAGQVAEFDAPEKLLEDESSIFYSMATEAGLTQGNRSMESTEK